MAQPKGGHFFLEPNGGRGWTVAGLGKKGKRLSEDGRTRKNGRTEGGESVDDNDDDDDDDGGSRGGGDDDDHRRHDETQGDDEHADGAQTGWKSKCIRGYARYMLAV